MHKKFLLILTALCFLTFGNTLFNGFVGDDEYVLVNNTFYHSSANLPKLFHKSYLSNGDDVSNQKEGNLGSGEISYRPVKSLTYFIDYAVWKLNPFGYHLTNLLIHLLNCFLVYFLIFSLFGSAPAAFWAAVLFCVHPVQAETVNAISYRHGFLGATFVFLSFLTYLRSARGGTAAGFMALSWLFYFLAVFTVETAVMFPGILLGYEYLIGRRKGEAGFQEKRPLEGTTALAVGIHKLLGFALLTVFYLFIYLKVFPNVTLDRPQYFGGDPFTHVFTVFRIFAEYTLAFLWPFSVKNLPPFHLPLSQFSDPMVMFGLFLLTLAGVLFLIVSFRRDRRIFFFGLWFVLFSLPISNIIPLTTPMAYRFMYLPGLGALAILVIAADRLPRFGTLLRTGFVCACILNTVFLNFAWKNGLIRALHMARDYPGDPAARMFLGQEYYGLGQTELARTELKEAVRLGLREPRGIHLMGVLELDHPETAKKYFEQNVRTFPNFAVSYIGLGRYYLLKGELERARPLLERAVRLKPAYTVYGYLIQIDLMENRREEAGTLLRSALIQIDDEEQRRSLSNFLNPDLRIHFPVDIGI